MVIDTFTGVLLSDEWRVAHGDLDKSIPYVVETMLDYFKRTQKWEKLTRVLPVYLGTKLTQPGMAILLRAIDVEVMGGKGPERPYEHSIEKQIDL